MTLVLAGILLIVPVVYGAGGLAVHLRKQFTQRNALTDTGIVLDWTRDGAGAERFRREILSLPAFDRTLLVTPTPAIALAFPSTRVLIAFDGPSSVTEHYRGTATGGVTFVAAPWLAESAVEFVKGQFVDVHSWSRVALKSVPGAHVWQGH